MGPIAAVLLDVEGTTTPIAFVRDTLFPFARERLPGFLEAHSADAAVAAELAAVRRAAPAEEALVTLLNWMDHDAKATPLKTLQGMIWQEGYDSGALRGEVYPDVAPCLRRWAEAGLQLAVYSSGSVEAQKLIFGRSTAGDLAGLFTNFFDTRIGAKKDASSYDRIAIALGLPAPELLFLSDSEAELDAAATAGMRTCQVVRPQDETVASANHWTAPDLAGVEARFALASPVGAGTGAHP